jgi:dTDP-4-amino-4,6-dideoxygalactose transaminase
LEFERRLAEHLQLPAGGLMSASSGTAALIGTIIASAGRATPERPLAFMPSFTFVGTASAAEICGYQPYPQAPWASLRQETGMPVVIDGAASFEAAADAPHRFLGPIPVALSFHATKSFATAEGGGIATTDLDLAKRAAQVLNFGCWGSRNSALPSINGKMSEYHAAVGLAELDGWASKSAALRAVADAYRRCSDQMGLFNRLITTPLIAGCYVLFRCFGMEETTRVKESLGRKGIDFRLWYGHGLHHQTYFTGVAHESLDATEELAPNLLGLPLAPDLSEAAITRVVSSLADGVNGQRS